MRRFFESIRVYVIKYDADLLSRVERFCITTRRSNLWCANAFLWIYLISMTVQSLAIWQTSGLNLVSLGLSLISGFALIALISAQQQVQTSGRSLAMLNPFRLTIGWRITSVLIGTFGGAVGFLEITNGIYLIGGSGVVAGLSYVYAMYCASCAPNPPKTPQA